MRFLKRGNEQADCNEDVTRITLYNHNKTMLLVTTNTNSNTKMMLIALK